MSHDIITFNLSQSCLYPPTSILLTKESKGGWTALSLLSLCHPGVSYPVPIKVSTKVGGRSLGSCILALAGQGSFLSDNTLLNKIIKSWGAVQLLGEAAEVWKRRWQDGKETSLLGVWGSHPWLELVLVIQTRPWKNLTSAKITSPPNEYTPDRDRVSK